MFPYFRARCIALNGLGVIQAGEEAGVIFAWGRGREGQLGNGLRSDSATPVSVAELQGRQVLQASSPPALQAQASVMPGPSGMYG